MRLYVFFAFLIVCIIAVNAAQQNHPNKRTQLAKKKLTNGAVATNSNHLLKVKPRPRSSSKSKKVRKIKPARKAVSRKSVRRVVKKNNRRSNAPKKLIRKSNNRNSIRRGSRVGTRKRLAKQELSDSTENKSIGAGQANGGDIDTSSGDKTKETTNKQAAPKPVDTPAQPAVPPVAAPSPAASPVASPVASENTNLLSSPGAGGNPLSSSPFNIPKATGQNQAIGAAFSQSSNGGSAFAAGFASIGKSNTAGGYGQVNSDKQGSNPSSETLNSNTAEEPAASDTSSSSDDGSTGQLAAYRRRPRHG